MPKLLTGVPLSEVEAIDIDGSPVSYRGRRRESRDQLHSPVSDRGLRRELPESTVPTIGKALIKGSKDPEALVEEVDKTALVCTNNQI